MIVISEKEDKVNFTPGTLIYDGSVNTTGGKNVILVVRGYDETLPDCFCGVYLKDGCYSDGLSLDYLGWKNFTGKVTLEND